MNAHPSLSPKHGKMPIRITALAFDLCVKPIYPIVPSPAELQMYRRAGRPSTQVALWAALNSRSYVQFMFNSIARYHLVRFHTSPTISFCIPWCCWQQNKATILKKEKDIQPSTLLENCAFSDCARCRSWNQQKNSFYPSRNARYREKSKDQPKLFVHLLVPMRGKTNDPCNILPMQYQP